MKTYRYFENRDELFALVRIDAFRRFADEQEAAFHRKGPRDTLLKLKEAYIAFATREPHAYAIMFQLTPVPQDYPGLNEESFRGFSFLLRAARAAVKEGLFEGDPRPLPICSGPIPMDSFHYTYQVVSSSDAI